MLELNYEKIKNLPKDKYRESILFLIKDLEEKYYKLKKLDLKSLELFNKKTKHKQQIRKIRSSLVELYIMLDELDNDIVMKKVKCPISYNEIISLDYRFKINIYELFNSLKIENNINKKIILIKKIKLSLRENINKLNKKDYVKMKKLIVYFDTLQKEYNKEKNKNVSKERVEFSCSNKEIKKDAFEEHDINDDAIYYEILNGKSTASYLLKDVMEIARDIIRKYDINENLVLCINDIVDRLNNERKSKNVDDLLISILDASKVRKISYNKESNEHKILKNVINILKEYELMNSIYNNSVSNFKNSEFDIIESLLYDENNYFIIKKLIIAHPNIINTSKNNVHIIEYILKLYLENYEKLLNKETNNYINVEYLKSVYLLITKNPYLHVDKDVEGRINKQIYTFIRRLTNDTSLKQIILDDDIVSTIIIKSDKKKKKIMEDTKLLSTHYYNYNKKEYELKKLNEGSLENQIHYVSKSAPTCKYAKDEIDLFDSEVIVLNNKNVAYNITEKEDEKIVKVCVPDMSNFIPTDTSINSYIYNQMLKHERIDNRILEKFEFKNEKDTSCLVYEFSVDKTNKISNFKIYKAKIRPKYDYENSEMYTELSKFSSKINNIKNLGMIGTINEKIYYVTKKIINDLYLDMAIKSKLPITYYGVEERRFINTDLYSKLTSLLCKLDKEESDEIYKIIVDNLGEFHYSNEPFNICGNYDLGLIGELNYIYLENQRIIKSILLNELSLDQTRYLKNKRIKEIEHKNMLLDLNASINYKDVSDFDYKNRKKKKKILFTGAY